MPEPTRDNPFLDVLSILHGGKSDRPKTVEVSELSVGEIFRRDCLNARYNIFQLVDREVELKNGTLVLKGQFVPDTQSGFDRPITNWIKQKHPTLLDDIVKRSEELAVIVRKNRKDLPEDDPTTFQVGNSVLIITKEEDKTKLIIFGAISPRVGGTYRGGRTNYDSAISFEFKGDEAVDRFLKEININDTTYSEGTDKNYKLFLEIVKNVFPSEVSRFAKTHMFHWQEVNSVFDLRKK